VNGQVRADGSKSLLDGIEQGIAGGVVGRLQPFVLELAPEAFGDVEMGRVGRQVAEE
jgi:hypothetical protein